jgi:hypothetical protein
MAELRHELQKGTGEDWAVAYREECLAFECGIRAALVIQETGMQASRIQMTPPATSPHENIG